MPSFKNTLIIISITIVLILGSQVYRTVTNYQLNKQRFVNDVQVALDLSVEKYYADRARSKFSFLSMNSSDTIERHAISSYSVFSDSLTVEAQVHMKEDSLNANQSSNGFSYSWSSNSSRKKEKFRRFQTDSTHDVFQVTRIDISTDSTDITEQMPFRVADFTKLTQKLIVSTVEEGMNIEEMTEILSEELDRKGLVIGFALHYDGFGIKEVNQDHESSYALTTTAKSTYLGDREALKMNFENASVLILKRGAWDLALSFAIVFSVIGALLYLYRIIKNQKELAMIKDDLIGNVTHEFKTPIATVTSALEGIANFNEANDKEKTERYLSMSRDQLAKLNVMVEKLMETATIDSGEVEIHKEEVDLAAMMRGVAENFKVRMGEKSLRTEIPASSIWAKVDPFHIENVICNLLDNAIKYGGDEVILSLKQVAGKTLVQVTDNGGNIPKAHQDRIFEKLYRIPKGNQHDVKGFGIGLYYTKAIVEQHGGHILLSVKPSQTQFTVTL